MREPLILPKRFRYVAAALAIAASTFLMVPFRQDINSATVALGYLLVILFVAIFGRRGPALLASVLAVLCFNFFFLPPFHTFAIADPQNWIALFAFFITAIAAGHLSASAKRRAEEAELAKQEIERLYFELQDTFERSSQAKALKQSERLKSALLDAVTHDLRTPLTSIKASATTLLADLYSSERDMRPSQLGAEGRKEMLEVINEESDRLDHFVEALTKLARIDAGELNLRTQWCAIDEVIAAALKRAEPRTRDHQMEVWIEDELPRVNVDEPAISEVVYILVDNAAKYSPSASTIRVTARPEDGKVLVSVEDEGAGIPPDLRERVFGRFFRATRDGDAGDRKRSGSGMGLAIAHGIVQAHGGRIWIEDADGHPGAKFVMELPALQQSH
jgi:two-component system sensor histidine kinase KdpD